ncbi:hypothetical protein QPM17_00495 [Marinobacter sp. TBZ242]|uniref:Uncharacterized protein n=1 Tax=Marinobacter azerbaijanicus TaxID=3050455 RepID=A0ABT7I6E5_9GAMM|nr:hypothetical protein [Marinobacter sp. TBZ242]MDL0429590.1 hypothetical protein [Marinobacter sp. TBZ242]
MNIDAEIGLDRITRSTTQMKAMLLMIQMYLENAERGQTDIIPDSTLASYLWAIEQNVEAVMLGTEEVEEIIKQAKLEAKQ